MVVTLTTKHHLIDNVWSFRFTPSEPLTWEAGQFVRVELPHNNPDAEGTKRWFTVSSAPYEHLVQITTRITNTTFKQALAALPIGGELQLIEQPDGDFIWQDSALRRVFVAGGIGVTPFYSMIKQRVHDGQPLPLTLLYSSRDGNVPFKDEFATWAASHPEFSLHYVTGMPLTAERLAEHVPNITQSLVYVSGPEPMVEALGDQLRTYGLPETQLKQDFFPNYNQTNY